MHRVRRVIVVFAIALVAGCATGGRATTAPSSPPPSGPSTRAPGDPTRGQFINTTSWALQVWVDQEPVNGTPAAPVTLKPGETVPWTLGQGHHRIIAHAHSVGQALGTVVARFDRTVALDPKRPDGWFLRFREADFR
jgi:hypothetical protein